MPIRIPTERRMPGYVVPGIYRELLRRKCEDEARREDYGSLCVAVEKWPDGWPEFEAQRAARVVALFEERIAAGRPFEISAREVPRRRGAPGWLIGRAVQGGARVVRVYADDALEPADPRGRIEA
jgi:hypothetical protein